MNFLTMLLSPFSVTWLDGHRLGSALVQPRRHTAFRRSNDASVADECRFCWHQPHQHHHAERDVQQSHSHAVQSESGQQRLQLAHEPERTAKFKRLVAGGVAGAGRLADVQHAEPRRRQRQPELRHQSESQLVWERREWMQRLHLPRSASESAVYATLHCRQPISQLPLAFAPVALVAELADAWGTAERDGSHRDRDGIAWRTAAASSTHGGQHRLEFDWKLRNGCACRGRKRQPSVDWAARAAAATRTARRWQRGRLASLLITKLPVLINLLAKFCWR